LNQNEGTRRREATIIVDVPKARFVPEGCRKYGFTQGQYREWADEFMCGGIDALKVNRNGLEAEYRAEIKRLQVKIGELVMDSEIRKEALRIAPNARRRLRRSDAFPMGRASRLAPTKGTTRQSSVEALRSMNVTPHIAQNDTKRHSAIDATRGLSHQSTLS
jgi:transposase-like protein